MGVAVEGVDRHRTERQHERSEGRPAPLVEDAGVFEQMVLVPRVTIGSGRGTTRSGGGIVSSLFWLRLTLISLEEPFGDHDRVARTDHVGQLHLTSTVPFSIRTILIRPVAPDRSRRRRVRAPAAPWCSAERDMRPGS